MSKILRGIEKIIFKDHYFSLTEFLNRKGRVNILWKFIALSLVNRFKPVTYEINVLVYADADERMLIPLLFRILERLKSNTKEVRVNLILYKHISADTLDNLSLLGCNIEKNHLSLLRASVQPKGKIVLLCLDQQFYYGYHRFGVDTARVLTKFGVKTISIQHGGTREDSVRGLASSESRILLIFGKRVFRELVHKHRINPSNLRIVGNPLHDRLVSLDRNKILEVITKYYPDFQKNTQNKKLVLLASSLHLHYDKYKNAHELYKQYIKYVYENLDFSKIFLIVNPHPADNINAKLYREFIPQDSQSQKSILIVEPHPVGDDLDVYSLVLISDLVITRSSTIAEEALLMGKGVIAFDLMEDGPSKYYRHLEEYGCYRTVYPSGCPLLKDAVTEALSSPADYKKRSHKTIEEDIAYSLDGHSTDRAVNEIFKEL